MPARLAVIVAEPAATPVASPLALTVAAVDDELQLTRPLRSRLLPSWYVPVAVNCRVVFTGREAPAGEMAIDAKLVAALVTCSVAVACNFPEVADTVIVPAPTAVTFPAAAKLAMVESEMLHCAEEVRF